MLPKRRLRDVILRRRLQVGIRPPRYLTVSFERPHRSGPDWLCWFEVKERRDRHIGKAYGVDGIQALLLAIESARIRLTEQGVTIHGTFCDEPGGFPRLIPVVFERAATLRLYRLIDSSVERIAVRELRRLRRGKQPPN